MEKGAPSSPAGNQRGVESAEKRICQTGLNYFLISPVKELYRLFKNIHVSIGILLIMMLMMMVEEIRDDKDIAMGSMIIILLVRIIMIV